MNWEAIAAFAEGLGALGVIASLLYLAAQVRQNTRASRVEAKLTATGFLSSYTDTFIAYPDAHVLFLRGRRDAETLTSDEFVRFSDLCLKAFWFFSAVHFQLRTGMLSDDEWHETRAVMDFYLRGPGVRTWWSRVGHRMFGPVFCEFVVARLEQVPPSRSGSRGA